MFLVLLMAFVVLFAIGKVVIIMKRRRMSRGGSKRLFSATAAKVHPANGMLNPERGGWRL